MIRLLNLTLIFLLAGCATSTGVKQHGANLFRIEAASEFGADKARNTALDEAIAYCARSSKFISEESAIPSSHRDAFGDHVETYALIFRCTATGEPSGGFQREAQYPQQEPAPERRVKRFQLPRPY